ncbi:MAG: hypothetical protein HYV13_00035 [Candidatus Doudnabacteria bacterium]|nr:hypothetical protein [Candidatus Doudnabacteria bacterium]
MKRFLFLVPVLLLATNTVLAAEFLVPAKDGDPNVSTSAQETIRNLYAAGATVNINGNSQGDLFAAGGVVTVNGNVEDDLFAAGGNININGVVGGNLRTAGGNISISSPVGQDLLAAGGNIAVTSKAAVNADLVVAGGNVVVDSEIKGKAKVTGGNITINGKINGNLEVIADEGLTFGPTSEVVGKVTYKGRKQAVVKEGARIGQIEFTELKKRGSAGVAGLAPFLLVKILATFAAGWLTVYFLRRRAQIITDRIYRQPWQMLGLGLAGLVLTPVVVAVLFATVIGYYVALVLMAWYFFMLLLSCLASVIFTGAWVIKLAKKYPTLPLTWLSVLVGVLVVAILWFVPVIGWAAILVLFLLGFGSVLRHTYDQILESR